MAVLLASLFWLGDVSGDGGGGGGGGGVVFLSPFFSSGAASFACPSAVLPLPLPEFGAFLRPGVAGGLCAFDGGRCVGDGPSLGCALSLGRPSLPLVADAVARERVVMRGRSLVLVGMFSLTG